MMNFERRLMSLNLLRSSAPGLGTVEEETSGITESDLAPGPDPDHRGFRHQTLIVTGHRLGTIHLRGMAHQVHMVRHQALLVIGRIHLALGCLMRDTHIHHRRGAHQMLVHGIIHRLGCLTILLRDILQEGRHQGGRHPESLGRHPETLGRHQVGMVHRHPESLGRHQGGLHQRNLRRLLGASMSQRRRVQRRLWRMISGRLDLSARRLGISRQRLGILAQRLLGRLLDRLACWGESASLLLPLLSSLLR
mmetsp:Transcript_19478/g.34734  ORF Transcript_19478/g.34734 Transcript_19478/m.34734 type:complete len:250 (-) Transcript_19478:534-1283(-)